MSEKDIMDKLEELRKGQRNSTRFAYSSFAMSTIVVGYYFFQDAANVWGKWLAGIVIGGSFVLWLWNAIKR